MINSPNIAARRRELKTFLLINFNFLFLKHFPTVLVDYEPSGISDSIIKKVKLGLYVISSGVLRRTIMVLIKQSNSTQYRTIAVKYRKIIVDPCFCNNLTLKLSIYD